MARFAYVFDKALFHLASVREQGLPEHQAYVHGGLFWGWVVDRGLHAPWLEDNTPEVFRRYREREISGPELLKSWDGGLLDDMFSDEGLAFAAEYLDFHSGSYLSDYLALLAADLPSEFHVADSPENQRAVSEMLDARHAAWRETWNASAGRPNLREVPEAPDAAEVPETLTAPVLPVTAGVPLPGGPLGIRAGRPGSVRAVEAARDGDGWLLLVPLNVPGRHPDPGPDDLLDIGVLARIRTVEEAPGVPGALDVLVGIEARAELTGFTDSELLSATAEVPPPPEPEGEEEITLLEEVKLLLGDVVKRRMARGDPPGQLALAPSLPGARMVDVVARELALAREEALIVLEAPDLRTRVETIRDALLRQL